MLVILDQ